MQTIKTTWKLNLFLFLFLISIISVSALPVTYHGTITIDGNTGSDVDLRVESDLETFEDNFDNTYVVNIAGTETTNTLFYIWDEHVNTETQPVQTSSVEVNLSFKKYADDKVCVGGNDLACQNDNCLFNICKPTGWMCYDDAHCSYKCNTKTHQCIKKPSSGGGGGSSGCRVKWNCTEWDECQLDSTQNRVCVDLNECDALTGKPDEEQSCDYIAPYKEPTQPTQPTSPTSEQEGEAESKTLLDRISPITGAVVGVVDTPTGRITLGGIIGLSILGLLIGVMFMFYGGFLGADYFSRAAYFHQKAQQAHMQGKTNKSQRLYRRAENLRQKGRNKIA
ncbi:MAG: hypothetical protein KAQ83_02470 [Nanoarchaeota archaeon]|nr:hypothetical protein [Nanoarchaeota archaeon]